MTPVKVKPGGIVGKKVTRVHFPKLRARATKMPGKAPGTTGNIFPRRTLQKLRAALGHKG